MGPGLAPRLAAKLATCALLAAALCWGAGNVANKTVLADLSPLMVVGLRCLIAVLVILPLALPDLRRTQPRGWWRSIATLTVLFTAALSLQQWAYGLTTVSNASFLVNTATVLTPLLAWLAYGHKPGRVVLLAAAMTLGGAFLLCGGALTLRDMALGDGLCLGAAFLYALWMVAMGQHAVQFGRPMGAALIQFAGAAVLTLPVALLQGLPDTASLWRAGPELLMLGVVSTALAFGLLTWAQRFVSAATAAVLISAESVFGAAGAWLVLDERLGLAGLAGAAIILAAIVLVAMAAKPSVAVARARPANGQQSRLILSNRVA